MNIKHLKLLYASICVVLGIVILSPTLAALIPPPENQKFSEFWILGEDHTIQTETPKIIEGKPITFYLGICNRMGDLQNYLIYAKLRNVNESMPNRETGTPSELAPIMEYRLFLRNDAVWEKHVSFSVDDFLFQGNTSQIARVSLDGNSIVVNKSAPVDEVSGASYYYLFFELWIYSSTTSSFHFHNRSVGLWIRLNSPA